MARRLAGHGIYTIIDLHQDAWGPSLAARPGESCPAGAEPALGWDGAPAWATLDGGAPRCASGGLRESSPAVRQAFAAFFADASGPGGVGIQTRYVRMLRRVARHFARDRHVAGFDLMNEPNAFGAAENAALSRFYARGLRAVRAGERAGGGRRHLVLFEPTGAWSLAGGGAPPAFRHDRDVVYAPHVYEGSIPGPGPITRTPYEQAIAEAREFGGAPVLVGEWGGDPDRAADPADPYFTEHARLQSELRVGATLWTWRESCGDPHKVGDLRAGREAEVWGEFELDCRTNRSTGPRRRLIADLAVAYARAAPGRVRRERYRPGSGRYRVTAGGARRGARLVVFYPRWKHGGSCLRVRAGGLTRPEVGGRAGGGLLVFARARRARWSLTAEPC